MGFDEGTLVAIAYACFGLAAVSYILHLVRGRKRSAVASALLRMGQEPALITGPESACEGLCSERALTQFVGECLREGGWFGRLGMGASIIGLMALSIGLALRSVEAGHWPFASTYEFALVFVGGIVLIYLILEYLLGIRAGGAFVLPIAFIINTYALVLIPATERAAKPLVPALQSIWLQIHVATAIVAYGAFASACGAGLMYLVKEAGPGFAAQLPSLERIDHFAWRAVAIGFPWMTLVILTGAIWAQIAWGRYWGWDIKETWALITWLVYLIFLHARVIRGWRGRPMAILSVVGFLVVIFTFLGLGTLARWAGLASLHLY